MFKHSVAGLYMPVHNIDFCLFCTLITFCNLHTLCHYSIFTHTSSICVTHLRENMVTCHVYTQMHSHRVLLRYVDDSSITVL